MKMGLESTVRSRFALGTAPSHVSIPTPKSIWHDGQKRINLLGKIQPPERYYELAFVFSCATRLYE